MPRDEADHRTTAERLIEQDRREEWSATDWERNTDALDCLRAAGFNREQSARALPAALALSAASSMDLGRAAAVATEMVILMRKIEMVRSYRHDIITLVP